MAMTFFTKRNKIILFLFMCLLIAPAFGVILTVEARSRINGKIAFASNRDGNFEIYIMNVDGSEQTRLTNNNAGDENPDWSPDGSKIAFVSNRDGNYEIYIMNTDGSGQTRLTNNNGEDWNPSWSPNGTKIAFVSNRDGNFEVYVMNADGSGQARLTYNNGDDEQPRWSPDGTKIVINTNRDGNMEIYVIKADGSEQTRLTNNNYDDQDPDWSPDGTKISYISNRDGNHEIYVMNSDGSGLTRLINNNAEEWDSRWSPDGTKITFDSNRDGNWNTYIMNTDGSGQTRLTDNGATDWDPSWQSLSKQTASLTLQSSTTNTTVDTDFFLNATLSVPKSGTVTLYWSINGSGFDFSTTETMTNGKFGRTFAASSVGVWAFKVVWSGDDEYEAAESNHVTVNVNKRESSISCSASSSNPTVEDSVTISGSITPSRSGITITISYKSDGSWNTLTTVTSSSDGSFSYSWTPSDANSYQLKASWAGDDTYNGATSSMVSVTVKKISTSTSCSTSSSTITNGETITTTGSINPAVSGKTVTLTYTKPDGTSKVTRTVTTNSDGSFSDSYKPDAIGTWSVTASWDGDATHEGTSSTSKSFTVNPQPSFFETPTGMATVGGGIIVVVIVAIVLVLRKRRP
jgi:Tol biopolymer transport system component